MDEAMQRRQVLIVDGYNVIRNNRRYAGLGSDYESGNGWNKARESLINDAAHFAQGSYERCTVVFDGAGNPAYAGEPIREAGIEVVFSPAGVSADTVIEKLAHDARDQGLEVVVVSSDFTIQATVYGGGVTRMSAAGFGIDSEILEQDWRENAKATTRGKNTVADRIDADTLARLNAMVHDD